MMRRFHHIIFALLISTGVWADSASALRLILNAERQPELAGQAQERAMALGYPIHIFQPGKGMAEPYALRDGEPLYVVITDFAHPSRGAFTASYPELRAFFDFSHARIRYDKNRVQNPEILPGATIGRKSPAPGDTTYLVLDSSNDRVMMLDYQTGDIIDPDFIPNVIAPSNSSGTPIQAQHSPRGTITVSDQLQDGVIEFDTSGAFIGYLAPLGGINNTILNNCRGHHFLENGNLLVTSADASNNDAIAEFDPTGNFLGNFIANGAGGLDSPWDILVRETDALVSTSASDLILRYDLNGAYLDNFAQIITFPRQIVELPDGNIAIANSSPSTGWGIHRFSPTGSIIDTLTVVDQTRGIAVLGNGHYLTTNAAGVFEIDPLTDTLIRTVVSGVSTHFFSLYIPAADSASAIFRSAPDSLSFGGIAVDSLASRELMVFNDGGALLTLSAVTTDPVFSVAPDTVSVLPGDTAFFSITFAPDTILEAREHLIFSHNGSSSADSVQLSGTGTGAFMVLSDTSVVFSDVAALTTVRDTVFITNTGNADLHISDLSFPPQFGGSSSGTIPPQGTGFLEVIFTADTTLGIYSGTVGIANNAINRGVRITVTADVTTAIADGDHPAPQTFALGQNYPNPFNPVTTVRYQLPLATDVRLSLFDLNGRLVTTVVNRRLAAGTHLATIDGTHLASGVYFYVLETPQYRRARKMLLLK